jgi:hypothetical protein
MDYDGNSIKALGKKLIRRRNALGVSWQLERPQSTHPSAFTHDDNLLALPRSPGHRVGLTQWS